MALKDWITWLGPCVVAIFTAVVGPTLVAKINQRNNQPIPPPPPPPLTPEQQQDADAEKRLERLRKDVAELQIENDKLRALLDKRDLLSEIFWDHYESCAELRKKYAQLMKERLEKK